MDEEHRCGVEVKGEFRDKPGGIFVATFCVRDINAVSKGIRRINTDTPLHIARDLVDGVDRVICLMP